MPKYSDTPIEYNTIVGYGRVDIQVDDEDCNADLTVTDGHGNVIELRLDRDELAALIASAARALASLSY